MAEFAYGEIKKLIGVINQTTDHEIKDGISYYGDNLIGLLMFLKSRNYNIGEECADAAEALFETINKEHFFEQTIEKMFKRDCIDAQDVNEILDMVKSETNEYQRGKFNHALLNFKDDIAKMTPEAKSAVSGFLCAELEKYLKKGALTGDEINNLEIAADVCKYFPDDKIITLLQKILPLNLCNVNYYAIETLLNAGLKIGEDTVVRMANDLEYADMTYDLLKRHNQLDYFPKDLTAPEYLAKSNMVNWLAYPTELGKTPDEIELLGDVDADGEKYYIFKYKSDSDTLSDDLKNQWLIGWASNGGGTFSNFDKLSDYEKKDIDKTLKVIKKKLLK